jgi:SAM-dependent methyltransferase
VGSNRLTDAKFWESFYSKRKFGNVGLKSRGIIVDHFNNIFQKHLSKGNLDLIEFGCGDSRWLPYFAKYFGYKISGIDYSDTGINLLQKKLEINNINGKIYKLDFTSLLPKDLNKKFDLASSFGVIEHFDSPMEVLKIFKKTIKKNGIIITVVPKLTGLQGAMQRLINKDVFLKHNVLNMKEFIEEHRQAGLNVFFSSETGFITLGINFGAKWKFLNYFYRGYCKVLNTVFRNVVGNRFVDLCKIGSSFLILSRKM